MTPASETGRALYEAEIARHALALREALIRHDENAKALTLMEDVVPYFLHDHPEVGEARQRTWRQSGHVRDPASYRDYYATNVNERPFEQQYGLPVEEAHRLPRVAFLRGQLSAMHHELVDAGRLNMRLTKPPSYDPLRILDLAGNDGFMAANLASLPFEVVCDLVDLHPGNCALARERAQDYPTIGGVYEGDAVEIAIDPMKREPSPPCFDAVVAFELIEHVADPPALLGAMEEACAPNGFLFLSTPDGAVEGGNLPDWDRDEPKGHVRVYTEESFRAELEKVGAVERFLTGPDRVMVAQVKPA